MRHPMEAITKLADRTFESSYGIGGRMEERLVKLKRGLLYPNADRGQGTIKKVAFHFLKRCSKKGEDRRR